MQSELITTAITTEITPAIFDWRYDRRSGSCNLSNWKLTRKNYGNDT